MTIDGISSCTEKEVHELPDTYKAKLSGTDIIYLLKW